MTNVLAALGLVWSEDGAAAPLDRDKVPACCKCGRDDLYNGHDG